MSFRNAIFAGGGSRCFWQLGFWEGAKSAGLDLQRSVRFVGSTSAGCAMATAAVLDRAHGALSLFQGFTRDNPRNIHWWNLHPRRRGSLFPHASMYRQALAEFIAHDDLATIQKAEVHFLMSDYPKWLRGTLGAVTALSIYALEKTLRGDPLHPRWPAKFGFTPLVGRASECRTLDDYITMVLAASCVPPVLPEGRFGDRDVLDGGLIENIPVRLADSQPGRTLVLASRKYDHALPANERVTWVQPSKPIRIDKFDYANPEGLQETFDLGLEDGRDFVQSGAIEVENNGSTEWHARF